MPVCVSGCSDQSTDGGKQTLTDRDGSGIDQKQDGLLNGCYWKHPKKQVKMGNRASPLAVNERSDDENT